MQELRAAAARQYLDAVAVFEAVEQAVQDTSEVRGGMYWHKSGYLVRTSTTGAEKGLGARSPENERIYDAFMQRKRSTEERLAGLKRSLQDQRRLNRALRVGRVDPIVVDLLNRLEVSKLSAHFRVVGTHALYAYEAAAAVIFDNDTVATRDIDLLWDVSRRVRFATQLSRLDSSMIGILRKVDSTFRVLDRQKYTAVNQAGFQVDILRREPIGHDPHPHRLSADEDDFWVAQAPGAHVLLDSPPFTAVIVASNGDMARMNTLHPLTFARFKRWLSGLPGRDAVKRRRDKLQAEVVEAAVHGYLPNVEADFAGTEMPPVPQK